MSVDIIVEISVFRGNIHVLRILSAFLVNIYVPWILSAFHVHISLNGSLGGSNYGSLEV